MRRSLPREGWPSPPTNVNRPDSGMDSRPKKEARTEEARAEGPDDRADSLRMRRPPFFPPPGYDPGVPQRPPRRPSPVQLAEAYVPWQAYAGFAPPGELPAPGTIFPELLRTPPLYKKQI